MVELLRVRVLGGLAVEGLEERALGSLKARRLLKVLVLARGAAVPVDRLVDVLWGDAPPARPTDQVGVLVSRLRGVLGADRLRRTDAGYLLVVSWLDLDELAARVGEAGDALARGRFGAASAAAEAAIALARGTVLPEEEGDWVEVERAAAHACSASARRVAAEAAGRAGHDSSVDGTPAVVLHRSAVAVARALQGSRCRRRAIDRRRSHGPGGAARNQDDPGFPGSLGRRTGPAAESRPIQPRPDRSLPCACHP